jgi:molecular chaperone HscB
MNYFELFGLATAPAIDRTLLTKKYFELQKQNHPDFHTRADDEEKEQSLALSASINKGYTIFQSEDSTIEYFLKTIGSLEEGEKYELPNDFLMEMMELNEMATEDNTDEFLSRASEFSKNLKDGIMGIMKKSANDTLYENEINKLKEYYYKKKYLNRILDRMAD